MRTQYVLGLVQILTLLLVNYANVGKLLHFCMSISSFIGAGVRVEEGSDGDKNA